MKSFKIFAFSIVATMINLPAEASIIYNPPSIIDHGTYITDTVNHQDWYKFSNAETTVGLSYDNALAKFSPQGWAAANDTQIWGLQAQFGWEGDTADKFLNNNYGLTYAMADWLGYTSMYFVLNGVNGAGLSTSSIAAMTSYTGLPSGSSVFSQLVTLSENYTITDEHGQEFSYGDYVKSNNSWQSPLESNGDIGTWLTRASSNEVDPDCRNGASVCSISVPEPAHLSLFSLGLLGLILRFQRKA